MAPKSTLPPPARSRGPSRDPSVFRVRITRDQAIGLAQRNRAVQDAMNRDAGQQRAQLALSHYAAAVLAGHGITEATILEVKDTKPLPTLIGRRLAPAAPAPSNDQQREPAKGSTTAKVKSKPK